MADLSASNMIMNTAHANPRARSDSAWSADDSARLYNVSEWSAGCFNVNAQGQMQVSVDIDGEQVNVPLVDIVTGMQERGLEMPAVLRVENLLDQRISLLNKTFAAAIDEEGYQGEYRGVFPIKVNQQCHVIEEIAGFGSAFHHGLEAGSKAELIIALSQLQDHDSLIICNGYKDAEFIDLGLYARQMGIHCFFVLETPSELDIILERSTALGVRPLIGARMKLATVVDGHWNADSGDRSIFGLSTTALLTVIDQLKQANMLDCLQLLHCHLGSQIPNIRNIRTGVMEACRFYSGLVAEGAKMGYLDLGGGLAVDYEGTQTNSLHSMNYQLAEYCSDIVKSVCECLDPAGIAHPTIITESGRATVAYSSMLLFNVLDVHTYAPTPLPAVMPDDGHELLGELFEVLAAVSNKTVQSCFNDAIHYRDEIRELFYHGQATMRDRALAENLCLAVFERIVGILPELPRIPSELLSLPEMLSDIYYCNFSLFQSLPDIWAIDQVFPVMPIHRLNEKPTREAILADLTCDCDGKIDLFALADGKRGSIPLHPLKESEEYYLGVFLVGAYQETLGDLHNLFGDTNVVSVHINHDGSFDFVREFEGDSIADVLQYVEYDPKNVYESFRKIAENAVRTGKINVSERQQMLRGFKASLDGYTYFER